MGEVDMRYSYVLLAAVLIMGAGGTALIRTALTWAVLGALAACASGPEPVRDAAPSRAEVKHKHFSD